MRQTIRKTNIKTTRLRPKITSCVIYVATMYATVWIFQTDKEIALYGSLSILSRDPIIINESGG